MGADENAAIMRRAYEAFNAADIDAYFEQHDLPRHPLVAEGYPSIGCSPCTHKVAPGEDPRSGRWSGRKVGCGIHIDASSLTSQASH